MEPIGDMEFIRCPVCGGKTRDKIRRDTELKNFPLFCPKRVKQGKTKLIMGADLRKMRENSRFQRL